MLNSPFASTRCLALLACSFQSVLLAAQSAMPVTVVNSDGDDLVGLYDPAANGISVDGRVLPFATLAQVSFSAAQRSTGHTLPALKLSGGDTLAQVELTAWKETSVTVKHAVLGELQVPTARIDAVVFHAAGKKMPGDLESFLSGAAPTEDLVLTLKGEQSNGFVEKSDTKGLTLNSGGQARTFLFEQLAALRFAALQKSEPEKTDARLSLLDGSQLSVKFGSFDKDKLSAAFLGQRVELAVASLARLDTLTSNLAYLSDWTPADISEQPQVAGVPLVFTWRKDRSVVNGPLKIGEKTYERGLGLHSVTRLSFDLHGEYTRFITDVGLDASAPAGAGCQWKIILDGKDAAQGQALSAAAAKSVRLDLTNVRKLELVCEDLPGTDGFGARLDFGLMRLIKRQ